MLTGQDACYRRAVEAHESGVGVARRNFVVGKPVSELHMILEYRPVDDCHHSPAPGDPLLVEPTETETQVLALVHQSLWRKPFRHLVLGWPDGGRIKRQGTRLVEPGKVSQGGILSRKVRVLVGLDARIGNVGERVLLGVQEVWKIHKDSRGARHDHHKRKYADQDLLLHGRPSSD